jgi:hypothetical protein
MGNNYTLATCKHSSKGFTATQETPNGTTRIRLGMPFLADANDRRNKGYDQNVVFAVIVSRELYCSQRPRADLDHSPHSADASALN